MNSVLPRGKAGKILIVDDAGPNLQLLTNLLRAHGYTVFPASDGELALEMVQSQCPDLILLDIRMPGMDGYEVCRRLKADERTRDLPVIFISILEDEHDKVQGFREGAVDYITKPFQPEEVLARIRIHLRLRELNERLEQTVAARTAELRTSERRLADAQRIAGIGCWEWTIDGNRLWWSDETFRIFDIGPEAFGADFDSFLAAVHPDDRNEVRRAIIEALGERGELGALGELGNGRQLEYRILLPSGEVRYVHEHGSAEFDASGRAVKRFGTVQDITGRRRTEKVTQARLRMLELGNASDLSLNDMIRLMLDEIEDQTESRIGFFHFVGDDQQTLKLQNWSTNTLSSMCTAEGKGLHYPVEQAGVWADCVRVRGPVIHNDYASLPHRCGMPKGHAEVKRELVVPIFRGCRIVAIIGVGNKQGDYTESDVQNVTLLGDFSWEIVERKRAEEQLLALNLELEERVRQRTVELVEKVEELARVNRVFVGRELRMVELKERIRELEELSQAKPSG